MRKPFLPAILLSLTVSFCQGQHNKYRFDATIAGAFPVNGFAENGAAAEIGMTCNFSTHAGYSAVLRWQTNKMGMQTVTNSMKGAPASIQWSVQPKNWQMESFMVGSDNAFPISRKSEKLMIRVRLMAGCTITLFPGVEASGKSGVNNYTYYQSSISAISFSTLVGTGLLVQLKKGTYLTLNGNYFETRPTFGNTTATWSGMGATVTTTQSGFSEEIKTVSADLGIRIEF